MHYDLPFKTQCPISASLLYTLVVVTGHFGPHTPTQQDIYKGAVNGKKARLTS